jgi:hypothetical protein
MAVEFENTRKAEEIISKVKTTVDTVVTIRLLLIIILFPRILLILLFTIGLFDIFFSFPLSYCLTLICVSAYYVGGERL